MMSTGDVWVEANFRETGLTHMRPGQAATIDVDAYPGHAFKAHVVSMSPGTGSDFAMLPPENATGNWVKVVQRLPVRLELDAVDPKWPLYSGISVTARVDIQRAPVADGGHGRSGPVNTSPAPGTAAGSHRALVVAALLATYMQAVNISLPNAAVLHIQGGLSMTDDEIGWVFTSYIAASAIVLPMTHWLAARFGRKTVFQVSLALFSRRARPRHAGDDATAIRLRADPAGRRERHARPAVDGDPAR